MRRCCVWLVAVAAAALGLGAPLGAQMAPPATVDYGAAVRAYVVGHDAAKAAIVLGGLTPRQLRPEIEKYLVTRQPSHTAAAALHLEIAVGVVMLSTELAESHLELGQQFLGALRAPRPGGALMLLPEFVPVAERWFATGAGDAAVYTGANWTNATNLGFLAAQNPNPFGFASGAATGLMGNATLTANAARAGIPANFFVANPDLLGGALITTNSGSSTYDSLQIELRRRYSDGLQFQTSYVLGHGEISNWETWRREQTMIRDAGTPGDVTHQFKANVVYDLPFGQGRKWGSNANGFVDTLIGGWQVGLSARVQSGRLVDLGNVRIVGMSRDEVQDMFKLRFDDAGRKVWMLPEDVINQTINAFSVSATSASGYSGATPTGKYFAPANGPDCIEVDNGANYGDCAEGSIVLTGPMFRQFDLRVSKRTKMFGSSDLELSLEALNVFNQANFVPVGIGSGATQGNTIANYEVTALQGTNTSRLIQLGARFSW